MTYSFTYQVMIVNVTIECLPLLSKTLVTISINVSFKVTLKQIILVKDWTIQIRGVMELSNRSCMTSSTIICTAFVGEVAQRRPHDRICVHYRQSSPSDHTLEAHHLPSKIVLLSYWTELHHFPC